MSNDNKAEKHPGADTKPGKGGGQEKKVDLTIIVSGDEVSVKAKIDDTMGEVAEAALKKSEHKGRPLADWDLRNAEGELLDLQRTVASYALKDGDVLSLTLQAGIAG